MQTKEKAPQARGASSNTSFAGHSSTPNDWLFSPIRRAAYEAEQRALEDFEHIAEVMPGVARRLTAELLPDPAPAEVVARRRP